MTVIKHDITALGHDASQTYYNPGQNISDRLCFSCEIVNYEKSSGSIFDEIFTLFLLIFHEYWQNFHFRDRLSNRLQFYEVLRSSWYFLISKDPKSYVIWQLVRKLVDTMFITNNPDFSHLWRKENLINHQNVSKYYDQDCSIYLLKLYKCSNITFTTRGHCICIVE